jgi:hypothetical protein
MNAVRSVFMMVFNIVVDLYTPTRLSGFGPPKSLLLDVGGRFLFFAFAQTLFPAFSFFLSYSIPHSILTLVSFLPFDIFFLVVENTSSSPPAPLVYSIQPPAYFLPCPSTRLLALSRHAKYFFVSYSIGIVVRLMMLLGALIQSTARFMNCDKFPTFGFSRDSIFNPNVRHYHTRFLQQTFNYNEQPTYHHRTPL